MAAAVPESITDVWLGGADGGTEVEVVEVEVVVG